MDFPAVELAPWQWWANFGVLGMLALVSLVGITAAVREWWSVQKPYLLAKQKADLEAASKVSDGLEEISRKLTELEVKVETMWLFHLRRGMAEAVDKGLGTLNSPLVVNDKARQVFGDFGKELEEFYRQLARTLSDAELALEIEMRFGDRILKEVCVPNDMKYGSCLLIAVAIAKQCLRIDLTESVNALVKKADDIQNPPQPIGDK